MPRASEGSQWAASERNDHLALVISLTGLRLEVYLLRASGLRLWVRPFLFSQSWALRSHCTLGSNRASCKAWLTSKTYGSTLLFGGSEDLNFTRQIEHHLFALCQQIPTQSTFISTSVGQTTIYRSTRSTRSCSGLIPNVGFLSLSNASTCEQPFPPLRGYERSTSAARRFPPETIGTPIVPPGAQGPLDFD